MLIELLLTALTPASRAARRMDFLSASVGLWSRGWRRSGPWRHHYGRCHAAVRRSLAGLPQRRKVVVLGSGLVRDVPADELVRTFREVVLVDVVHLPIVRLRFALARNVRFVTADLSGMSEWVMGRADGPSSPLPGLVDGETDLVISANMLSQMPIGVEFFLESRAAKAHAWPEDLLRQVVEAHLAGLRAMAPRVCLLTDVLMEERDRQGRVTDTLDLMRGAWLPAPDEAWEWTVAPFGEVERDREYVHTVHAYADFKAAQAEPLPVRALSRPSPGP